MARARRMAAGGRMDSVSGEVLGAAVSRRVGGGSPKAADQWELGDAENAIAYWCETMANRLASWTSGMSAPAS